MMPGDDTARRGGRAVRERRDVDRCTAGRHERRERDSTTTFVLALDAYSRLIEERGVASGG